MIAQCAHDNIASGVLCFVAEGKFQIYYTSNNPETESKTSSIDLIQIVYDVFKNELQQIPNEINAIRSISISFTTEEKNPQVVELEDEPLSSSSKALIGVAIVCSSLIVGAVLITIRGKKKLLHNHQRSNHYSHNNTEMSGMIPDRQIRSDDSVSNSPTMSSGARGNAWDAARSECSQSDSASDTSSRPSFSAQLNEPSHASHGIEATRESLYQSNFATYLPSSVLKDLLDGHGRAKSLDALDTVDL